MNLKIKEGVEGEDKSLKLEVQNAKVVGRKKIIFAYELNVDGIHREVNL